MTTPTNWPNPERPGVPPKSRAMMTREEQIADVFPGFYAEDAEATVTKGDLRLMLEHAERRAEQRVRAEIGRDSERLDWLEKLPLADIHRLGSGWEIGVNNISFSEGKLTLRETIDAAQEVG